MAGPGSGAELLERLAEQNQAQRCQRTVPRVTEGLPGKLIGAQQFCQRCQLR